MSNKQSPEPLKIEPALLTITQVCEYLNIARATFYKINATGAFGLLPVRLGFAGKSCIPERNSTLMFGRGVRTENYGNQ